MQLPMNEISDEGDSEEFFSDGLVSSCDEELEEGAYLTLSKTGLITVNVDEIDRLEEERSNALEAKEWKKREARVEVIRK